MAKKRKKHPVVHVTLRDPLLSKDPKVQKFLKKVAHDMGEEIKLRMRNMLVYGTSHPEFYKGEEPQC